MMSCILQSICLKGILRNMFRSKDVLRHFSKCDTGPLRVEIKKLAGET